MELANKLHIKISMSPISTYFIQPYCDRCEESLSEDRRMSFFNKETICLDCFKKEEEIRTKIIEDVGEEADLEYDGCGFVPRVREIRKINES
jgi:hypothetical protein